MQAEGLIIVVADMFMDKNGRIDENKTKCDILLVHSNRYVKHMVQLFPIVSATFVLFSKMLKKQIIKQTIQHMKRASIQAFSINQHDEKEQIKRHVELRQSQFVSKLKMTMEKEDIVDESRGSIFYRWERKSCNKRPKHMELLSDVRMPLFEPEYDTVKCFESGTHMGIHRDEHSGKGILNLILEHKVNFIHGHDQQPGSLVSVPHSIQFNKYYPPIDFHCTWDSITLAEYKVNFPKGMQNDPFNMSNTSTKDMGMFIPSKRKRYEEFTNNRPLFFSVEIPWIFRMFTNECEVLDNAQDMEKVKGAWSGLKHTSASYQYFLSMFFPEEMAESLTMSINTQFEKNKHEEEKELYRGNIHCLFVGINPTLNSIKCMCTDLVLGMILISNGLFRHREKVCQLMYMAKYMDTVFQLDSIDEMPPYLYLNHAMSSEIHRCYADVRKMHKNTRQILISEYISDVVNEVFYGGSIMTHEEKCKLHRPLKVEKNNLVLLNREIFYRLGRSLDDISYESVKLATNVLIQQTGIYKQEITQDSRIYDLRNITVAMSLADSRKLSKTQTLVRQFALTSKKNKTFRRTGYVDASIKYKKGVFKFLEDFKMSMDSDILHMIKTQKNEIAILDKQIDHEIHQILKINTQ